MAEQIVNILNAIQDDGSLKLTAEKLAVIKSRSQEIYRTMECKIPRGSLKKAEQARPSIALECAFKKISETPPTLLRTFAGMKSSLYEAALLRVETTLQLRTVKEISVRDLGLRFGMLESAVPLAVNLLKQVTNDRATTTVYKLAAYMLARKKCGEAELSITRKQLLDEHSLSSDQFERVMKEMEQVLNRLGTISKAVRKDSLAPPGRACIIDKSSAYKKPSKVSSESSSSLVATENVRVASSQLKRPVLYLASIEASQDPVYLNWKNKTLKDDRFIIETDNYKKRVKKLAKTPSISQ